MNHWGANHCVLTAGHVGHLFITLASILRIPVYMHNVADDRIFRPSAWNGFGTAKARIFGRVKISARCMAGSRNSAGSRDS